MLPGYEDPTPERPVKCGRYELLERIGFGGMAEVFKARLPGPHGFQKIVVVKRILPRLADDQLVVRMFIEEAKIAAAADHDNIAQVFELGQSDDGKHFMVMEYIRGVDLEMLLAGAAKRSLRCPPWFAVHMVAEVLEALGFVHSLSDEQGRPRNVIHRDATPSNIFVSFKGQVKLSDFGVADFEGKAPTTRAGQLKGKLSYMSPEQLSGNLLDQRTDIFTMGVVLWEALCQQRLFGGLNEMQAMLAICEGQRQRPSELAKGISVELDKVVLKALAIERDERYTNAAEFQADLLEVLHEMHRPVRHVDVREVLQVLLGRMEPTGDLMRRPLEDSDDGEQSFLHPIDDEIATLIPAGPTAPSPRAPSGKANIEDTHLHEEPMLPGVVAMKGVVVEEEPTQSVTPDELRRLASPSQGTEDMSRDLARQSLRNAAASGSRPGEEIAVLTSKSGGTPIANYPFWLRSQGKSETQDFAGLLQRLENESTRSGSISADGVHWISVTEYAQLTGQDYLIELEAHASRVAMLGAIKDRSLVSVFGILARDHSSGTLTVARSDSPNLEWYEVHVSAGRPTRVSTNLHAMQLPRLLQSTRRLTGTELAALVHGAVLERRPLLEVAKDRDMPPPEPLEIANLRLTPLFSWVAADYTFTIDPNPPKNPPLAPSIMGLLPRAVSTACTDTRLREALGARIGLRHEPSWRFEDAIAEMGFDKSARELAAVLCGKTTVLELLERAPERAHVILSIAYLLLEADLMVEALEE